MKTPKKKTNTRVTSSQVHTIGRFLRYPRDLDKWLQEYARQNDYSHATDVIREALREFKQRHSIETEGAKAA